MNKNEVEWSRNHRHKTLTPALLPFMAIFVLLIEGCRSCDSPVEEYNYGNEVLNFFYMLNYRTIHKA